MREAEAALQVSAVPRDSEHEPRGGFDPKRGVCLQTAARVQAGRTSCGRKGVGSMTAQLVPV